MIYLVFIFFRLMIWLLVLSFVVVVFFAWALMWVVVFIFSIFYVAINEKHKKKRLKPPSISQARWSNRR